MKRFAAGLAALGPARLASLAGVGLATLALLALFAWRLGDNAPMSLLYNDLDLRDASAMDDLLTKDHIPHQLGADGTSILAPSNLIAPARLDLAKAGLPTGGSIGYEIFDRSDSLTASQFQDTINETRALEGELSRSIALMRGVRGVRVHLVLPRHEPFAQQQQQAQASVLLTLSGGMRIDHEAIQAILNLVAAAVPGLRPENIAIVDARGEVLARAGQPSDGDTAAATEDEIKRATEARFSQEVEQMLARSLGDGHVRAEAAVEMDFDTSRETDEKYDPDGQVARSTQSVADNSKTTEKNTSVSVQNNLPNPGAPASGAGTQDQRNEETTNYEIGKTVRTVVHDQPSIRRISLAVMVDDISSVGPDGKTLWKDRSPAELAQIATLVRGAIGYDAARGDKVDIVSMHFADDSALPPPAAHGMFHLDLGAGDTMRLAELGLFGILSLVIVLAVLRPTAIKLASSQAGRLAGEADAAAINPPTGLLAAPDAPAGLLTDESMIDLANVEGQIRASSIRKIADLVDKHPDDSLSIVRGWMAQEPA
jgi:flagellar M-ring protein FliF